MDRRRRDGHGRRPGGAGALARGRSTALTLPLSDVNGLELYWERAGDGERLLFCNGSGATLADARPMLALLDGAFDLLAWDYRGLGRSAPVNTPYTMADVAADAVALLDEVGWERCRVLGVSFGGMVAQELAVTHPERIERLVLACTSAGGEGGSSYPLPKLLELPPQQRSATALAIADSRWDDDWLAAHPLDRVLADNLAARLERGATPDAHGRQLQMHARAGHDVWDRLASIQCPTLVAFGRHDGIAPPANSEAIASRVRAAELRGYEGGHMFLLQDPTAMPELTEFLQASAG